MKKTTKLVALILSLVMLLPTAVSCIGKDNGNGTSSSELTETTTATPQGPSDPENPEQVCYNVIFALATVFSK